MNVLAPYFTEQILIGVKEAYHYSIMFDASNKGSTKIFPICVQYFSKFGVKKGCYALFKVFHKHERFFQCPIGIIDLIDDADESALKTYENLKRTIEKFNLPLEALTSIGADNTNVNMGSNHSVYSLFQCQIENLIKGNFIGRNSMHVCLFVLKTLR